MSKGCITSSSMWGEAPRVVFWKMKVRGGLCWLAPETGFIQASLHAAAIPQLHWAEKPSITSAGDTSPIKHNIIESLFMIFHWKSHFFLRLGYVKILNHLPVSICRAHSIPICERSLYTVFLICFMGATSWYRLWSEEHFYFTLSIHTSLAMQVATLKFYYFSKFFNFSFLLAPPLWILLSGSGSYYYM